MSAHRTLITGVDGLKRCSWCGNDTEYMRYHDVEWGVPVIDDRLVYEKICLEGFQAGLSWLTILRKRPAFRSAFKNFEPKLVARYSKRDVDRLLKNAQIIRHRGKIEAAITNARATLQMQDEGVSLAKFIWSFTPENYSLIKPKAAVNSLDIRSFTEESRAMSRALRLRGFKFVGATTMYAAMQSLGIVNDHFLGCSRRQKCEAERAKALKKMLA